ncbi:hypothetical protein RIR_jg19172.t1 [Rhizophagus irregularis DAOM 181602=DAOM 197198]|nr:hypothetical protein RIR_jg19172.t1 [Rhizophagus irregularis DAOM 181602=DAOM 197198]
MLRKTKRQLQAVEERKESEIGENWIESENINDWTNKEFEKVGKRLITEVLCWQENATSCIRAAYTWSLLFAPSIEGYGGRSFIASSSLSHDVTIPAAFNRDNLTLQPKRKDIFQGPEGLRIC